MRHNLNGRLRRLEKVANPGKELLIVVNHMDRDDYHGCIDGRVYKATELDGLSSTHDILRVHVRYGDV